MARPAKQVDCNEGAKTRLLEIVRSRKKQSGLSLRAKIGELLTLLLKQNQNIN